MHRKQTRSLRSRLFGGWRKYVLMFLGMAVAAGLGISAASSPWKTVPPGNGKAYGKGGKAAQGIAIDTLDLTNNEGIVGLVPGSSGTLLISLENKNSYAVIIDGIGLGNTITAPNVAGGCTATNGVDFNIASSYTPSPQLVLAAGAQMVNNPISIPITTTNSWPGCVIDQSITLDITITAEPQM